MATGNGSTTLRRYRVKNDRGRWEADIVIADDGYFSTVSDWGKYAFWWGSAGKCFRTFLTELNADYLCSKLGNRHDFYDGEETEKNIKRRICDMRRSGSLTKEKAREEWGMLRDYPVDSREGFAMWWEHTTISDASELSEWTYEPSLRGFAENVWPMFAKMLRDELAAERAAAHSSGHISSAHP